MKAYLSKFTSVLSCLLSTLPAMADVNDPDASDDPSTPIDEWAFLLVIIALILGIYFLNKKSSFIKG